MWDANDQQLKITSVLFLLLKKQISEQDKWEFHLHCQINRGHLTIAVRENMSYEIRRLNDIVTLTISHRNEIDCKWQKYECDEHDAMTQRFEWNCVMMSNELAMCKSREWPFSSSAIHEANALLNLRQKSDISSYYLATHQHHNDGVYREIERIHFAERVILLS